MTERLFSIEEAAELENSNYDTLIKKIQRGKLQAIKKPDPRGYKYLIELDQLSEKARRRYFLQVKQESYEQPKIDDDYIARETAVRDMRSLTASQREDVDFWAQAIKDWHTLMSNHPKEKTAKTREYIALLKERHPERSISERTLYRKCEALKEGGEAALADERRQSKKKGRTVMNDIVRSTFLQWWLDEARPTITQTRRLVEAMCELRLPELLPLPSEATFRRLTEKVPQYAIKCCRYGEKAFDDECMPYLKRIYEFDSNDIWSADYHTLDCFVKDDVTGKVYRPHAIVWIDVRSRKILSASLFETSNSDGTVIAFRKAVTRYGIPGIVYLDNGSEFLVRDFGGKGVRKSDANAAYGTTILDRMGVQMHNAKVKNAKAKVIERAFKDVTTDFSKFVATYTGGRPGERPERLTGILKAGDNVPLLSEIRKSFETYIEGWYNEQPSAASGLEGGSPNDCYEKHLISKRAATADQLDMLLLRNERLQTVKRNGVFVKVQQEAIWFYDSDMISRYMGQKVYVRYNPEDFSKVFVYDDQERYLCEAPIMPRGGYDFAGDMNKESIKWLNHQKKLLKGNVTDFKDALTSVYSAPDPLSVLSEKAAQNIEASQRAYSAKMIEPAAFNLPQAVGGETAEFEGIVDIERMIANAAVMQKRRD